MKTKQYIDFEPTFNWLLNNPLCMIAFGFGSGLSKIMPGTVGSLVGFIPAIFIVQLNLSKLFLFILFVIVFLAGIWCAEFTERILGRKDYSGIVIDEIAAMILVLSIIPVSFKSWFYAFILFRIFDIWKPWPIKFFDHAVSGGIGVMLDDIIAALDVILLFTVFKIFFDNS